MRVYAPGLMNPEGQFQSRLFESEVLRGDEEEARIIEAFMETNQPDVIAKFLGGLTAAFHRQIYRLWEVGFPVLIVFAQGAQASRRCFHCLLNLHYYRPALPERVCCSCRARLLMPFTLSIQSGASKVTAPYPYWSAPSIRNHWLCDCRVREL